MTKRDKVFQNWKKKEKKKKRKDEDKFSFFPLGKKN